MLSRLVFLVPIVHFHEPCVVFPEGAGWIERRVSGAAAAGQALDRYVGVGIVEKWDRVTVGGGTIDRAMWGGEETAVGPLVQDVAGVHQVGAGHRWCH